VYAAFAVAILIVRRRRMPASIDLTRQASLSLRVAFAGSPVLGEAVVHIGTPWLGGAHTEQMFEGAVSLGSEQGVQLFRHGRWLLGHAQEPFVAPELAARSESLYRRVLAVTRGRHLYRIWNYVPEINAETGRLENYRAFCQGRSLAFEGMLGGEFQARLPAAAAVGCTGNRNELIFVAGDVLPTHFENPEQIPAYHYPLEHGPRSPSFARATVARDGARTWTFISGTSAIKGHETIAPGALDAQLECTLDNLRLIAMKSGLGDDLGAGCASRRYFKVYLRHANAFPIARTRLERSLVRPEDSVTYLQADICRAALEVEIEATLVHEKA
jgi:chorismate lyase / 3-hydroxybenzoate synthase